MECWLRIQHVEDDALSIFFKEGARLLFLPKFYRGLQRLICFLGLGVGGWTFDIRTSSSNGVS
jgi:hypothetical protein